MELDGKPLFLQLEVRTVSQRLRDAVVGDRLYVPDVLRLSIHQVTLHAHGAPSEEVRGLVLDGECDADEKLILIRLGQTPKERFKTAFHEILHAYEFESGKEIGEKTVRLVEHWVGMLIADNF